MSTGSEALQYIHGTAEEGRFFYSELIDDVSEGAIGHHYVQYNGGSAEIYLTLLLDEGDRYSVATFYENSSDPDDYNTVLSEMECQYYDSLTEAINAFGEEALAYSTQDNDEYSSRVAALGELNNLRERFGISAPPMKF